MTSTMTTRTLNFSAGPAILPESVIQQAQQDLWDLDKTGIGLLEHSHRDKSITRIFDEARQLCREIGNIPDDFEVLFLHGGASTQFAMIPMAFLNQGSSADYVNTGTWTNKAIAEAKRFGDVNVVWDGKPDNFNSTPTLDSLEWDPKAAYSYYCSNNTIFGTRWPVTPSTPTPLISDMSSEMYSRPIDWASHDMVYAGAQKNLGPAGVAVVIIRKSFLEKASTDNPSMFRYDIHADKESMYNTPPVFAVYFVGKVFEWIKSQGGLSSMEQMNDRKAGHIYEAIDGSGGFFTGHAKREDRSTMNITFRCPSEELEAAFIEEAAKLEMVNLKGHRSVGGLRASTYNAFPESGCVKLAEFMNEFARKHG